MHMADVLISVPVGGIMWAASASVTALSTKKLALENDIRKPALMGVLGAFVFAAQMINFSIPGTGASGHLGGGMLLAILLGPHAAFITLTSVLLVQALFFADGGLLALGCNIFNLGFFPCFVAYPFIYKKILRNQFSQGRLCAAVLCATVVALQCGAFAVVLETTLSGISNLPFIPFLLLMQPIHLAIGLVEGVVTFLVIRFVWEARPEFFQVSRTSVTQGRLSLDTLLIITLFASLLLSGIFSWFASSHPDGLEWALGRTLGSEELETPEEGFYPYIQWVQQKTSFLPEYDFEKDELSEGTEETDNGSTINLGTSLAGVLGSVVTLAIVGVLGVAIRLFRPSNREIASKFQRLDKIKR